MMDREGSAGITLQSSRGNIQCKIYKFDNENGGEVDSYKDKDLSVLDFRDFLCEMVVGKQVHIGTSAPIWN